MCGILAYTGQGIATEIIIEGLKRLEYRGYDSSGIAILESNTLTCIKKIGRVEKMSQIAQKQKLAGHVGIGHTRWATHGSVTDANAHPHVSSDGKFGIVHNGVIENYLSIKNWLITEGYHFKSETDSEVIANLVAFYYKKLLLANPQKESKHVLIDSVKEVLPLLEGTYGLVIVCTDYPDTILGIRKSSPLIIGLGETETLISSDAAAFAIRTQKAIYLKDGEIAIITPTTLSITTLSAESIAPIIEDVPWSFEESELLGFSHYMEKEIFQQPIALESAMRGRFSDDHSTAVFGGLNLTSQELRRVERIIFCACGTARYACLIAEQLIEKYVRIPVEVEYASEFRYRNAPLDKDTLVFVVSQSGETIDTLAALQEAQRKGYRTLAITNVVGSTIARAADGGIYQHAGSEIGVASTKAFTSQLMIAAMLALYLGRLRDLSFEEGCLFVTALKQVPQQVMEVLKQAPKIAAIAKKYAHFQDFLFLGRQLMLPIALEGALKLKEISYIHAEGYPAGEMKHGPIALIAGNCPSVFLATQDSTVFNKTLSNMQEVKARQGPIIAIITEGRTYPPNLIDDFITIPQAHEAVQPILATIPVQLLSYYIALELNRDIDKPRNLAKSVTVE